MFDKIEEIILMLMMQGEGNTAGSPSTNLTLLYIIIGIIVVIIIAVKLRGKKENVITTSETITNVKYLVICPYCASKVDQGIAKCSNCGADL